MRIGKSAKIGQYRRGLIGCHGVHETSSVTAIAGCARSTSHLEALEIKAVRDADSRQIVSHVSGDR